MRRILHTLLSITKLSVLALTLTFAVSAQNGSEKPQERIDYADVVNGRAKSLPKPEYPASALTEGAAGQIKVGVVIDETGRVISAEVIEGIENAALREAAKTAALKAEFSPMTNGKPVKFKGTIVYNFVPPASVNEEKRLIYGGVVNGKAKVLPAPAYPPSARQAGIGGTVDVTVLIDESGRVISAEASGGVENPALREAAKAAALKAEFSPTTLEGKPVKVKGTIAYKFFPKEETNAEKLGDFALATFLTVAKSFDKDLDKLKSIFGGEDILVGMTTRRPQYSTELTPLLTLSGVAAGKREQVIDQAISAIELKSQASAKWQLAAGREFGALLGPILFMRASGEGPDAVARMDAGALRAHLNQLAVLASNAPADVPEDLRAKLAELAALRDRKELLSRENFMEFAKRIIALLNTVSPS